MVENSGQMKIQQMVIMVLAIFFFFVLVGLFFLTIMFRDIKGSAAELQREQTISSIETIADMPEFNCDSGETLCIDEDKLLVMSGFPDYINFLPVSSITVDKIYPASSVKIKCPAVNCNYYEVFGNGNNSYSTFVSLCRKVKEFGYIYDRCEIAKLLVGAKNG